MVDRSVERNAPRPSGYVGVDVALLAVVESRLHVLLSRREKEPWSGYWALPGVFMRPGLDATIADAAGRAIVEKALLPEAPRDMHQLGAWHSIGRDPRGWVVSIVYFKFVAPADLLDQLEAVESHSVMLATVDDGPHDELVLRDSSLAPVDLAFDHDQILNALVRSIRAGNDVLELAFEAVGKEFTLRSLQGAVEVIGGRLTNKDSFRRSIVQQRKEVVALDQWQVGVDHRPARLYRRRDSVNGDAVH